MRTPSTPSAWYFSAIRTPLLLAGALATVGVLAATGAPLAAVGQFSVAYFTAVNIVCWWLLHRRLRAEGRTFADLIRPGRIVPDIAWGLLWVLVLYFPFAGVLVGTTALLFAGDLGAGLGAVFAPAEFVPLPAWASWTYALVAAIAFPLLNAPIEELYYRGYAQEAFAANGRPGAALLVPSAGFAVQHIFLAPTWQAALIYLVAFTCWGFGAALIRRRQGGLLPLIVAHLITNAAFGVFPVLLALGVFAAY